MRLIIIFLSISDNDYSLQNGLQLDMEPAIGQLSYKTVMIDKNDNAEGTIQFATTSITGWFLLHGTTTLICS